MRLHRLEITGFGPFRRGQVIDFDAFAGDGLFLIAGRTGAGKSSVLDAVCFALYGSIPRYAAGEKRLRSDHSAPDEPTRVVLEFSGGDGERYRIERSPEYLRPAKRGGGMTAQKAEVELSVRRGDEWHGLGSRQKDVDGELLPAILQLTKDQFLQVILLAQNRFAQFLLAKNDERRAVLRTLFDSQRFADYADALDARRKASEAAMAADSDALDARLRDAEQIIDEYDLAAAPEENPGAEAGQAESAGVCEEGGVGSERSPGSDAPPIAEPVPEGAAADAAALAGPAARLTAVQSAVPRALARASAQRAEAQRAEQRHASAVEHLESRRRIAEQQLERSRAQQALDALAAQTAEIAAKRAQLEQANAAEPIRASIDAHERALRQRDEAREHLDALLDQPGIEGALASAMGETAALAASTDAEDEQAARAGADAAHLEAEPLRSRAQQLATRIGALSAARTLEQEDAARRSALAQAEQTAQRAHESAAALASRAEQLPDRIAALDAQLASLAPEAARVDERAEALAAARAGLRAAQAAAEAAEASAAADRARISAADALTAALARVSQLMRHRLRGYAGELAAALEPGQACAVCGSIDHPSPAERAEDAVSEADIEQAERERGDAAEHDRDAAAAADAQRARASELAGQAQSLDVDAWQLRIDEAQEAANRAREAAAELARIREAVAEHRAEQAELVQQQQRSASELASARARVEQLQSQIAQADADVAAARGEHASVAERIAELTLQQQRITDLADSADALRTRTEAERAAKRTLHELIAASPFEDADAVRAALCAGDERARLQQAITAYDEQTSRHSDTLRRIAEASIPDEPVDTDAAAAQAAAARDAWTQAQQRAAHDEQVAGSLQRAVAAAAQVHQRVGAQAQAHETLVTLANTIAGREPNRFRMALETFVLAAELEEIVAAANLRLADMSAGRYQLVHSDDRAKRGAASGLGVEILDAHTGRTRPAASLSGGETFLASLALALGLAQVVTDRAGGVQLHTLFIDEGFGSLDAETLEVAMRTLDELRSGGRTVGVISHVEAMQEQIPARLRVEASVDGSSDVIQDRD